MNRSEALAYLASEYKTLASVAEIEESDSAIGYKNVINSALRELGYTESDLATTECDYTASVKNYTALLDYYALRRLTRVLATKIDYSIDGQSHKEQQIYAQAKELLEEATIIVTALGFNVGTANSMTFGTLNLDFLTSGTEF